ncbi:MULTISPECIES: hypothetical protein [unclassified Amycolatopsis]|uniref:hypothetical protein n=1 Tax=unclassified Amycolatopsis TaxID=2618356 RepID=UPI00106EDBCD|nr:MULTISPECIES: hypothetical protein [unclassified Amycolatopsis]
MTDTATTEAEAARWKSSSRKHEDAAKANAEAPAKLAASQMDHAAAMAALKKRIEDAERQAAEIEAEETARAEAAAGPSPVADFGAAGGDVPSARGPIGDPKAGAQLTMVDLASMTPAEIVAADEEGRLDALKRHGPRYGY